MEIVALVVIAGLIGWWFYRNIDGKKSLDNSQNLSLFGSERFNRESAAAEPVKSEPVVETKPVAEVTAPPEAVAAKPAAKAKKPPAMKKVTASKAIAKPKARKAAKK